MQEDQNNHLQKQKLPKLTKKQRGFVRDYVATGNGQEAALKNYDIVGKDKEGIARSLASENLTKPNVAIAVEIGQMSLKQALIDKGVTPAKIAERVEVLLHASDRAGFKDYTAIDKGLKHATNIYGVVDETVKQNSQGNTYNFLFSSETQADVKSIEDKIKSRLINQNVQENKESVQ